MFSSPTRPPFWLLIIWSIAAFVLMFRAGLYPAAMTGDEIWFTESAYQFLASGTPKRLIHADSVGSARADFLPPVIILLQAISLAIFGVSAKAVGMPGVLLLLLASVLVYGLARRAGAPKAAAGLAALTVFAAQTILRGTLYVRYEGVVLSGFLGFLLLVPVRGRRAALGRGILTGVTGLAYYPMAPFIGLAALLVETGLLRPFQVHPARRNLPWTSLGFFIAIAPFLFYAARYPQEFSAQILANGAQNYGTAELLRRFTDWTFWQGQRETLPEILTLVVGIALAALCSGKRAWAGLMGMLALPALVYPFNPRLFGVSFALLLALAAFWTSQGPDFLKRVSKLGLGLGALAGLAMLGLMTAVGALQAEGRDGARLGPRLKPYLTEPGPIAADQRAWLALRQFFPEREFLHLLPSWSPPQVRVFESLALRDPKFQVAYALVQTELAEESLARAPALAAARADGRLVPQARLVLPVRPLPGVLSFIKTIPFDLILYGPPSRLAPLG